MNKFGKRLVAIAGTMVLSTGIAYTSEASNPFKDVKENDPNFEILERTYHEDIFSGYATDEDTGKVEIRPFDFVSRAQAAKMLTTALGYPEATQELSKYSDVKETFWGHDYITLASELNIVNGYPGGTYKSNNVLTRAEAAKIIVTAFDIPYELSDNETGFDDVGEGHWAAPYVKALVNTGITNGTSDTTFSPDQKVPRYQMATFTDRFYQNHEIENEKAFVLVRGVVKEMQNTFYYYLELNDISEERVPFKDFKEEMLKHVTSGLEPDVEKNYDEHCRNCDSIVYDAALGHKINYKVLENTNNKVMIEYVEPGNPLTPITKYTLGIVKDNDKWKVNQYDKEYFEKDSDILNLSTNESLNYVESVYRKNAFNNVTNVELIKEDANVYKIGINTNREYLEVEVDKSFGLLQ